MTERQLPISFEVLETTGQIHQVLEMCQYHQIGTASPENNDFRIEFARELKPDRYYPRFHITMFLSLDRNFAKTETHIDERRHHAPLLSHDQVDDEIIRIIAIAGKIPNNHSDLLIKALQTERLFGLARQVARFEKINGRPVLQAHNANVRHRRPRGLALELIVAERNRAYDLDYEDNY